MEKLLTFSFKNSKAAFFDSLPSQPIKKVLIKLLLLLTTGFSIGIVLVGLFGSLINKIRPSELKMPVVLFLQNSPLLILLLFFFYGKSSKNLLKQLFPKTANRSILLTLLFYFVLLILMVLIFYIAALKDGFNSYLNATSEIFNQKTTFTYIIKSLLGFLIYLLLAAFEEFVFRFTFFRYIRKKGLMFALIISSIIFSFSHMNIGIPFSFLVGILLALHYEYTNSFAKTVFLHAFHNYFNIYYSMYFVTLMIK